MSRPLRLAFFGSPDFAVPALRALHAAGHELAMVYTQPPRPAGRGQALQPCAVQAAAAAMGLAVAHPERLRADAAAWARFAALAPDAAVVVAYGQILPPAWLAVPPLGCLNVHASLLPRWRGAAPIQAAILAGDTETGVTIMQMDAGLDTGPMLLRAAVPIRAETDTPGLAACLSALGAELIVEALAEPGPAVAQPETGASYAPKLTREDAVLDWLLPAEQVLRRIRGLRPWPGTETVLAGTRLKILDATLAEGEGPPGVVLDGDLTIGCGLGAIRPTRVQAANRAAMATDLFLRGHPVPAGTVLG